MIGPIVALADRAKAACVLTVTFRWSFPFWTRKPLMSLRQIPDNQGNTVYISWRNVASDPRRKVLGFLNQRPAPAGGLLNA